MVLDENGGNTIMASQLNNIRLKLEEKRRHIENEKRRMEVVMSKQRQKVGKAAFLQAVTKVKYTWNYSKHNLGKLHNTLDLLEHHYHQFYVSVQHHCYSQLQWFVCFIKEKDSE